MGKFKAIDTGIEGLKVIEPTVFADSRGYFMETWNTRDFEEIGIAEKFVQDNQSMSQKGVLRGMHLQIDNPQGKLVRVINGDVYDVAVDLRKDSDTFGKWYGVVLSEKNNRQFFIPEGFAHGFEVLSDTAVFVYKCTRLYAPGDELGIRYDDPELGIEWPDVGIEPILSEKDKKNLSFAEACKKLGLER